MQLIIIIGYTELRYKINGGTVHASYWVEHNCQLVLPIIVWHCYLTIQGPPYVEWVKQGDVPAMTRGRIHKMDPYGIGGLLATSKRPMDLHT